MSYARSKWFALQYAACNLWSLITDGCIIEVVFNYIHTFEDSDVIATDNLILLGTYGENMLLALSKITSWLHIDPSPCRSSDGFDWISS